jgi:transcriptional regulator with XRE-family HTH domain
MTSLYHSEYQEMIRRLVTARKAAGFTQIDAAQKLGTSQSNLSKIETCQRRLDLLEFKQMITLYNVSSKQILQN